MFYSWSLEKQKPLFSSVENCGHRIHVLFMMYDVYWYCQMEKNEWLQKFEKGMIYMKILKKGG